MVAVNILDQMNCSHGDKSRTCSRKRSRTCRRENMSTQGILLLVVAMSSLLAPVHCFSVFSLNEAVRHSVMLRAVRTSDETIQAVKPKTATSSKRRNEAIKAMKRNQVETALSGVDAQMLELLSDGYLYPNRIADHKSRPRGRPDFVPGAMNYETMLKFRERKEFIERASETELSSVASALLSDDDIDSFIEVTNSKLDAPTRKKKGTGKKRTKKAKGTVGKSDVKEPLEASDAKANKKKRKRVVKNLPEPRAETNSKKGHKTSKGRMKGNGLELQKYYRTELLTANEEYSLGMKIQFMMQCEQVHEGLATNLMRLPTIEEWAAACGFEELDPTFYTTEADEQIRPAGSETMFEAVDPNMFVGNGLAQAAGPGRGRGREKKPPPMKLEDFYDDSEIRAQEKKKKTAPSTAARKALKPINRGTPKDFVEMMMTAREAKQQMIQCNMRLVVSIARKYSNVGVSLQDLVQEGSLGLSRAAEKFDPSKGFKFSTYASWWIQQAVFRSIAYHSRTIRLPVHVHNLLNRVRKVRNNLQRSQGRAPTNEELAEALGMTLAKYNKMFRLTKRAISLEMPKYQSNPKDLGHESDDLLGDTIADDSTPEKRVDRGLFHDDLHTILEVLDDDERNVISSRYGLSDGLTRTVTAVAAQMKQSKAWVRSQECRALRKLRRPWYEKKLKEHQDALTS